MTDYSSYLHRLEQFVRHTNHLPGDWGIAIDLGPPLAEEDADYLNKDLPFGLPRPLREFYVTGAAWCRCTYYWEPDASNLPQVAEVFPHQYSLYGGLKFVPAVELEEAHGLHDWWDGCHDMDATALRIWRQTVPFIDIGNGDHLALHAGANGAVMPVVYLCHDDAEQPVTPISPSFEQFLKDWERLFYVGPEIWLLYRFLEDERGHLRVDQPRTEFWRKIITQCGR